jgi:hypothetical protein
VGGSLAAFHVDAAWLMVLLAADVIGVLVIFLTRPSLTKAASDK